MSSLAQKLVFKMLKRIRFGTLRIIADGAEHVFGEPEGELCAEIEVRNERFFSRLLQQGEVGAGVSYQDGDWTSPNAVDVIRLAARNMSVFESNNRLYSLVGRFVERARHALRANTVSGSRRNIAEHYDLSNDFFRLFLDRRMLYSSAYFEHAGQTLEQAQWNKMDRICRKLRLTSGDHILEIGTGWGGFALHAAREYGCRVTTTTISRQQYDYAQALFSAELPDPSRVELLLEDYRNLRGRYDHIVSIEMFEAVGLAYYDDFFSACDRLLAPDGTMLMQTIAMREQRFDAYRANTDWIQKEIFPGSELASISEILRSLGRVTMLNVSNAEDIGQHYALTLAEWRRRFLIQLPEVFGLGFDERFARTWEYYFSYCEAIFRERHIQTFQLLLTKQRNAGRLFGEPGENFAGAERMAVEQIACHPRTHTAQ
ncbi:MAG: cyclopropane-fatty-acyl-phospholipid synthase family protein [Acidobacteriota bacterium]